MKRFLGAPLLTGVAILLLSGCGVAADAEKAVEDKISGVEESASSVEVTVETDAVDVVDPKPVIDAPTGVSALAGNAQVKVSWSAPASTGAAPITGYTVSSVPGGFVCTTTGAKDCTVTGLVNGTPYSFTVLATTASGNGAPSVISNTVTPTAPVPGAPQGVSAQSGDGQVKVSWSAPTGDGNSSSKILGYSVSSSPGGFTCTTTGATSCTVSGLVNDTPHTFTVTATTATGTSAPSTPSNTVTPSAPVPGAPVGVSAKAGNGQAKVSWSAPSSTGGSRITGYTVTSSPGGFVCTTTGAKSCTVNGLVNNTPTTFTVTATTSNGVSDQSAPSNSVTPSVPVVGGLVE